VTSSRSAAPGSVFVAGSSRGIGAAIAVAFAAAGTRRIVLGGRTEADLVHVSELVRAHGAEPQVVVCDLTDAAQRADAAKRAGDVDVLVYSAGTNRPQPFIEVDERTYDLLFELNVRSGFFLAQAVVRGMLANSRTGCIAFISSQMGHVGAAQRTVYCASKHALEGLVKSMAVELAPSGIRVVSIAPTFVRTELTASQLDDPQLGPALRAQIPLGRYAAAEDVADAVVWATSPSTAMLTGTSIVLDGGWTAR
jgi:NAD(P)-dependent dehydrogenase (short-subunit alcohol dehydrogenase family)